MKKYAIPVIMLIVFETVAITLWLTKDNLFYLFNFSYIGMAISLGTCLLTKKYKHARRIVQFACMSVYACLPWSYLQWEHAD